VTKKDLRSGVESGILNNMDENGICSPIEQGRTDGVGEPWAIARHDKPLSDKQQALLDKLHGYDSRVTVNKSDVSMMDLAALTAKTGDEFAMFTLGARRLIVRGDAGSVNVDEAKAVEMRAQGYKWSGHTHTDNVVPSEGDVAILKAFGGRKSLLYDAMGNKGSVTVF